MKTDEYAVPFSFPLWAGKILRFYIDGFRSMTLGKTLWKLICIKLFIIFAVLKLFFFPDFLATHFETDRQRADYVLSRLAPERVLPVESADDGRAP